MKPYICSSFVYSYSRGFVFAVVCWAGGGVVGGDDVSSLLFVVVLQSLTV